MWKTVIYVEKTEQESSCNCASQRESATGTACFLLVCHAILRNPMDFHRRRSQVSDSKRHTEAAEKGQRFTTMREVQEDKCGFVQCGCFHSNHRSSNQDFGIEF